MVQRLGAGAVPVARSEAIQPSFWDRLVNDLPGLEAEIQSQHRQLAKELGGTDKLDALLEDGGRATTVDDELNEDTKRQLYLLRMKLQRRSTLQASGVTVTRDVLREAVRRDIETLFNICLLYTSPSPRDRQKSRMPSSA